MLNALAGPGTALLLYAGAVNVAGALITYGSWYLFVTSLDYFWDPMLAFSSYWSRIQGGLSAAERVFALIDAESAVVQLERRAVPALRGEIRFEHVGFYYKSSEPVLKDFDLLVRPGETLALVGHTGAGKSSIAKLVTRFYEFQSGRLLIDGMDIRTLDLQAYRRQLGIVPQSPFLFSGTVIDNIRYARPVAPLDEIEALARRIGGGEWLESLPEGLATEVGERGARLSMGQRQLVSLMRVLVQKPAIFILDEATANIDPFTEAQIQEALGLILAETTALLIAHRLSTVARRRPDPRPAPGRDSRRRRPRRPAPARRPLRRAVQHVFQAPGVGVCPGGDGDRGREAEREGELRLARDSSAGRLRHQVPPHLLGGSTSFAHLRPPFRQSQDRLLSFAVESVVRRPAVTRTTRWRRSLLLSRCHLTASSRFHRAMLDRSSTGT